MGTKAGAPAATLVDALFGGLAGGRALELRRPRMAARDFLPLGRAPHQCKDLAFVLELAREHAVPSPLGTIVDQLFATLIASGGGALDHSAVVTVLETLAAHRIKE